LPRRIGKYERLARERHERDLALAAQPGGHPKGFYFDQDAADRVIRFVERYCKHYEAEWAGQPIRLQEWQKKDVIYPIFGWKKANGFRRFRTAYIELARKNGKSFLTSALALYLLIADGEPGAQIYSSATKEEQATIVWRGAQMMADASKDISRFVTIHGKKKKTGGTIFCDRTNSFFRPLGSDSKTQDGLNPHAQVIDELHAHEDPTLWNVLTSAMGARRQPLNLAITTAGTYDPKSVGWQQHKHGTEVLDGIIEDDSFFAFICAIDEGDDPFDPENWGKANPNLGISPKIDDMEQQATTAKLQPSAYNDFLRLRLNRWTQQVEKWLSVEAWNACDPIGAAEAIAQRPEREKALAGKECFGGLDLSSKLDLAALVLVFPMPDDFYDLVCRFWLPEAKVDEEEKRGQLHYAQWKREGWLKTTPGAVIDYDFIRAELRELGELYRIVEVPHDPHNATHIATELGEQDGFTMVEHQQGFISMSEPSKTMEAEIIGKKIRHGGNPILRWCVSNAVKKTDSAGNIKPDKAKAKGKIDGLVAAIMGLGRAKIVGGNGRSYLETEPLLTV
jgi:phage terminase large subunit-like protein